MRCVCLVYPFHVVSEGTWRVPSLLIERSLPSKLGRLPHTHMPTHLDTYTHIASVRTRAHTHIHTCGQPLHGAAARPWRRLERRTPEPESEVGPGVLGPRESGPGGSCPGVPGVPPGVRHDLYQWQGSCATLTLVDQSGNFPKARGWPLHPYFFSFCSLALQLLACRPGLGGAKCSNPGRSTSTTGACRVPFGTWQSVTQSTGSPSSSSPTAPPTYFLGGQMARSRGSSWAFSRRRLVTAFVQGRSRPHRASYPPQDPRRRPPVDFHPLTDDIRVCCRQYFIPSNADIARMRRHRSQTHRTFKWNASVGIPLGEIDSINPQWPGQPRRLSGWPDFRHLLVVLDKGCHDVTLGSRFASICERCGKQIQPSLFAKVRAEMENALCTGRAFVLCTQVGM